MTTWLVKVLSIWLLIIVIESLNGAIRELIFVPVIGEIAARYISFITGLALIFCISIRAGKWIGNNGHRNLIAQGLIWCVLTFGFEIVLTVTTRSDPYAHLLRDYDIYSGGLMPYGLIFLIFAPLLAAGVRSWFLQEDHLSRIS